jgi:DNA-binding GntR family transcriptional regulator
MGVELSIPVDRNSPVPLYFQVAQHLEHMIESGALPAGSQLDNEIALADQLGLSRPTMRRAIEFLVDRGLLVRKRGVGTRVVHTKVRRPVELTSLHDDLAKTGRRPHTKVLAITAEPASPAIAYALGVAEGTEIYSIERLRFAGDDPLALMHNHVPADLVTLTHQDLEQRGLYDILRASGITMRIASQTIGARSATAAEARTLGEPTGAPLLTMSRTAYDDHGRAVEHGDHLYRASLYTFELTLASNSAERGP